MACLLGLGCAVLVTFRANVSGMSGSGKSENPDRDDLTWEALGARLRQERRTLRLTQTQVADALGVPRAAVVEMEAGRRKVSGVELLRASRLFGVSADHLLRPATTAQSGVEAICAVAARLSEADRAAVIRFAEFLSHEEQAAARG